MFCYERVTSANEEVTLSIFVYLKKASICMEDYSIISAQNVPEEKIEKNFSTT